MDRRVKNSKTTQPVILARKMSLLHYILHKCRYFNLSRMYDMFASSLRISVNVELMSVVFAGCCYLSQ